MKRLLLIALATGLLLEPADGQDLTPDEARGIAREAYVYGFPLVENYKTMYRQAIAPGPFFRAPFNQIAHESNPATPENTQVVWPNADTVMSSAWLDLRAEPIVLSLPAVEKDRYYSAQLVDLHTFNFGYLGTRATGTEGGDFLIAGPRWQGEKPAGVRDVLRCESQFAYVVLRTQLRALTDHDRVKEIQAGYQLRPLGAYLGQPVAPAEPPPPWPPLRKDMTDGVRLFPYLNFLLQHCEPHPTEQELMTRFVRLGVGPGLKMDPAAYASDVRRAVVDGIADVWGNDFPEVMQRINRGELTAAECFGSREALAGNFVKRAIGAKVGLYGNSKEEVVYVPYFSDREGRIFEASSHRYTLRFEKGQLPPTNAFWSLTLYDGDTHLLVPNPLNRHVIGSSMVESLTTGDDGSITIYIQKSSPGKGRESNWLPAPDGPFHGILRLYLPKPEAMANSWKAPELVRVAP